MRTPHIAWVATGLVVTATLGLPAPATADDPTGNYPNARVKGKLTDSGGNTERFKLIVSKFKLTRKKIKIRATDDDVEISVKLTMNLQDRVTNADSQTLRVRSGSIGLKDIASGTPLAWDGDFNSATYKVKHKSSGLFEIKHKKKLTIANLTGHPVFNGGLVRSVKVKATR